MLNFDTSSLNLNDVRLVFGHPTKNNSNGIASSPSYAHSHIYIPVASTGPLKPEMYCSHRVNARVDARVPARTHTSSLNSNGVRLVLVRLRKITQTTLLLLLKRRAFGRPARSNL